jgi:hypothetical protein
MGNEKATGAASHMFCVSSEPSFAAEGLGEPAFASVHAMAMRPMESVQSTVPSTSMGSTPAAASCALSVTWFRPRSRYMERLTSNDFASSGRRAALAFFSSGVAPGASPGNSAHKPSVHGPSGTSRSLEASSYGGSSFTVSTGATSLSSFFAAFSASCFSLRSASCFSARLARFSGQLRLERISELRGAVNA